MLKGIKFIGKDNYKAYKHLYVYKIFVSTLKMMELNLLSTWYTTELHLQSLLLAPFKNLVLAW